MPVFNFVSQIRSQGQFRAEKGIHDVAHILLIGDTVGGFRRKGNNIFVVGHNAFEKIHPGLRVELVSPQQGLEGDLGFGRRDMLVQARLKMRVAAK